METKGRNIPLQILRVVSCLMVFIVHFGQRCEFGGALRTITDFGRYGVHIFFLISGFLAATTFAQKPQTSVKEYYIKRAISILPLYYIVVAYYFIVQSLILTSHTVPADSHGIGWFRYLFLLNGVVNSETTFWSNLGMTWTIPVFACFYIIAPWLLKRIKGVFSAVCVWIGVLIFCEIIKIFYPCVIASNLHYLFLGAVLYWCVHKKIHKQACIICLICALGASVMNIDFIVYTFIFAGLILLFVTCDNIVLPQKVQSAINMLDSYSYTVYLAQGIIFTSVIDNIKSFGIPVWAIASMAVFGTAVISFIIGKFMEKPLQKLLSRILIKPNKKSGV